MSIDSITCLAVANTIARAAAISIFTVEVLGKSTPGFVHHPCSFLCCCIFVALLPSGILLFGIFPSSLPFSQSCYFCLAYCQWLCRFGFVVTAYVLARHWLRKSDVYRLFCKTLVAQVLCVRTPRGSWREVCNRYLSNFSPRVRV